MGMSLFDSAIKSLPTGANGSPAIKWFATLISEGIRDVRLNTEALHKPSTIEAEKASKLTGANLTRDPFCNSGKTLANPSTPGSPPARPYPISRPLGPKPCPEKVPVA